MRRSGSRILGGRDATGNPKAWNSASVALAMALLALQPGVAGADATTPTATPGPRAQVSAPRSHAPAPPHRLVWCSAKKRTHCRRRPPPVVRLIPPGAATGAPAAVSGTGATLTATVSPGGRATTYWFQYGLTTRYGGQTAELPLGAVNRGVSVSIAVAGLNPLAVYHYRAVASHCNGCIPGTIYAADQTLTVGGYENSVYGPAEAADPYVLDNGNAHDDYWAFTTGNLFGILHSSDLVHWTSVGTALTTLPSWVVATGDWHPWAPSVLKVAQPCPGTTSASCYVMYYVGLSAQYGANCVATAMATGPGGPYVDQGPLSGGVPDAVGRPIGCGDNLGYGVIDPSPFTDPATGQQYLYVSEDFSCPTASTSCTSANSVLQPTVSVIPLTADHLSAAGPRMPLFSGDALTWEAAGASVPTVEGPNVTLHNGTYYLFYSGGSWHTTYGMGYATAPSPLGPFSKAAGNPFLTATATVLSPGGGDSLVIGPHGGTWLVYHGRSGTYSNPRTLRIDPFGWRTSAGGPDVPAVWAPTNWPMGLVP